MTTSLSTGPQACTRLCFRLELCLTTALSEMEKELGPRPTLTFWVLPTPYYSMMSSAGVLVQIQMVSI